MGEESAVSEGFFYGPDEGAEAKAGALVVEGLEGGQDGADTVVLDDGHYGSGQRGPCVAAVVGLAVDAAASGDLVPGCESAAVVAFEHFDYALAVSLVEGYEYAFHTFCIILGFLFLACSLRRAFLMPLPANTQ